MTYPVRNIDERTFEFACEIVLMYERRRARRGAASHITSQLLRAGTSIGSNLAEARSGQSRRDFIAKSRIALKEARESHYWLRILERTRLLRDEEIPALVAEANEIVAILTTIVKKATIPTPSTGSPEIGP